ncbi:TonB-dependent receptor plug domain-containing protein, partial [Flavobacterium sp.]
MKSTYLTLLLLVGLSALAQEPNNPEKVQANDSIKTKVTTLDEVTIAQKRKYIKVESDKTTVSIKDNPMVSSGSSLDAIKKLPGVITSPTGEISLNGRGVRIFIDGAPTSLAGTDLQNYLSSLPANAIEKVELIYNPGASYDANASGSIINIVTNAKRKAGINASININYNFNKYQKPSPQVLVNGKSGKLSWQTMTGYNYIEGENRRRITQTFTAFTPDKFLDQENFGVNIYRNFYFRGGTNYRFNERSNLLFNY